MQIANEHQTVTRSRLSLLPSLVRSNFLMKSEPVFRTTSVTHMPQKLTPAVFPPFVEENLEREKSKRTPVTYSKHVDDLLTDKTGPS